MNRIPSSVPGKNIDRFRLDHLKPVEKAIQGLRLSLIQFRILNGILGALTMQVEDGGDNPEVNAFLVKALRSAVIHHVGVDAGQSAIHAIDAFQMSEEAHWTQTQNGSLPVIQLAPEERFIDQMQIGYQFLEKQDFLAACQTWIQAWEIAKTMARPKMRTRYELAAHRSYIRHPPPTVSLWVKASAASSPEALVPQEVKVAEMDELFTFIGQKKTGSTSSRS